MYLDTTRLQLPKKSKLERFFFIIKALTIQDVLASDGSLYGGIFYTILKPFIFSLLITLFIRVIGSELSFEENVVMLLIPVTSFFFILDLITRAETINHKENLLNLPFVKYYSILLSLSLSRLAIYTPIYSLCLIFFMVLRIDFDIFEIFENFIYSYIFGSLYLGVVSLVLFKNQVLAQIHSFIPRVLLFISCIFFPLSAVPYEFQEFFLLNPIVHIVEISRNAFYEVDLDYIDRGFLLSLFFIMGLVLVNFYHLRINIIFYGTK